MKLTCKHKIKEWCDKDSVSENVCNQCIHTFINTMLEKMVNGNTYIE